MLFLTGEGAIGEVGEEITETLVGEQTGIVIDPRAVMIGGGMVGCEGTKFGDDPGVG